MLSTVGGPHSTHALQVISVIKLTKILIHRITLQSKLFTLVELRTSFDLSHQLCAITAFV